MASLSLFRILCVIFGKSCVFLAVIFLDEVEALCAARAQPVHFHHCPLSDAGLGARLTERGYVEAPSCEVWARSLDAVGAWDPAPHGIEIDSVDREDDAAVARFARTVAT